MRLALILSAIILVLLGAPALADETPFTQCPAAGFSASCGMLFTINPDGTLSIATDPNVFPLNGPEGTDVLIGVVNDSSYVLESILLVGGNIFGFDQDGVCGYDGPLPGENPPPYASPAGCPFGPTGYEGPGTSFLVNTVSSGSVIFINGLAPGGGTTYFSLENTPSLPGVSAVLQTPEPASMLLLGSGLAGVIGRIYRRRRS